MSSHPPQTQFFGKVWIYIVLAFIFGGFGIFSLVLGPLFLFEIMKDVKGQARVEAGVALTIMSAPFLLVFALASFNFMARRRPMISLCREGLAINVIGASSLDEIPLIPGEIRVAWLILSLQGFKKQMYFAPWEALQGVGITGSSMAPELTIQGSMFRFSGGEYEQSTPRAHKLVFGVIAFDTPLDRIAGIINAYHQNPQARESLSSWHG